MTMYESKGIYDFTSWHSSLAVTLPYVLKAPDMLIDRLKCPQGTSEPESTAANRYTGRLTCSCGSIWPSWFCLECFLMVLHYFICLLFKMLLFTKMSLAQTRKLSLLCGEPIPSQVTSKALSLIQTSSPYSGRSYLNVCCLWSPG